MYKVLAAVTNIRITHKTDEEGNITYATEAVVKTNELRRVKLDTFDTFELEMVIDNTPKPKETHEAFDGNQILESEKMGNELDVGIDGNPNKDVTKSKVVGEISSDKYFSLIKANYKINIERTHPPKFKLEEHTKKLNVRSVDGETKLLEFYVSKYPKEYDRRSDVFIKNVLKIEANPRASSVIDFDKVSFTTYNDTGVHNNKLYEYGELVFNKVVEFDGHYIVKLLSKVSIDGEDQTEQYRMEDLDERYENKERRDVEGGDAYIGHF